jgi:hypothetical protein
VDFLTCWADRELLRIAAWDPDLAAERLDRGPGDRTLEDLALFDVVRETLRIAVFISGEPLINQGVARELGRFQRMLHEQSLRLVT